MARRALRLASWTSMALAASGFYLYSNKYLDPNDFGAVRVGRAVATTAVISYDYLTSLRSVPYGSEEYLQLRSKMRRLKYTEVTYLGQGHQLLSGDVGTQTLLLTRIYPTCGQRRDREHS
uniref:AarF domain containing kinase 1 n=1 Tax=Equus caballus TaxID=9796 RepID=A0A9L0RTR6_HORSE